MKNLVEIKTSKLFNDIYNQITHLYDAREAKSIVHYLLSEGYQIEKRHIIANSIINLTSEESHRLNNDVEKLIQQVPVQYITGKAWFYGLSISVNPAVLIPRPETEELVDLICKENQNQSLKILDIGTGSGCIALALKKELMKAEVLALDKSIEALQVAQENASSNQLTIHFFQSDLFVNTIPINDLDIIVSNPPYVCESEKKDMAMNVLHHEPEQALFVPDDDPLIFYRKILEVGQDMLKSGGKVYFEINEAFGEAVLALFQKFNYTQGAIKKDMQGKDRMAFAIRG